ncbi:hypothetical protein ACFV2H_34110 [Streptomyces sp. NPDC059629]|uniref:hypothetical protein n=1 Tax=Streptomyces sp. NPDC059629 TaxID=3346889 RepID=UPI0036863E48
MGKPDPFAVHKDAIRGFVFDVAAGGLEEVVRHPVPTRRVHDPALPGDNRWDPAPSL